MIPLRMLGYARLVRQGTTRDFGLTEGPTPSTPVGPDWTLLARTHPGPQVSPNRNGIQQPTAIDLPPPRTTPTMGRSAVSGRSGQRSVGRVTNERVDFFRFLPVYKESA